MRKRKREEKIGRKDIKRNVSNFRMDRGCNSEPCMSLLKNERTKISKLKIVGRYFRQKSSRLEEENKMLRNIINIFIASNLPGLHRPGIEE